MNIKKFRKDVRGAALVYVIVAAAIIILLGAATTATAYVNLKATQIQEQSNNNFYNADTIMNAVVGGLESDISKAYETAYTQIITNLNTYESMAVAQKDFDTIFINELDFLLNDGEEFFESFYSVKHIQDYVQNVFSDDVRYTISALNGNNYIDSTDEGIILRNLHITYEDDSGYYDEIITDVKIAIPRFDPEMVISTPQVTLDAFIIDDGLEISADRGLTINGDTYINERESDKSAILLKARSFLSVVTPKELVAGGFIKTENDQAKIIFQGNAENDPTYEKNTIWTENIDLGRYSQLDVYGQLNVHDDLEINGSYSKVKLAGAYWGYGVSNNKADDSSAINVNGAHAELNLQELTRLMIGGSAYLSASTLPTGNDGYSNLSDLQMGEAFSVKSNQIAYLVDDKEFTDSLNVVSFVSNPMSYDQYKKLIDNNGGTKEAAMNKIANAAVLNYDGKGDRSYASYGATVMPVFSSRDNGTVYLYLNFAKSEDASKFFTAAYKGDTLLSQRLRTYAAQYLSQLTLSKDTTLFINENYVSSLLELYTKDNLPTIHPTETNKNGQDGLGYDEYGKPSNVTQAEWDNMLSEAMQTKYIEYFGDGTPEGSGAKYKITYAKTINEAKLREFIQNATIAKTDHHTDDKIQLITNGVVLTGTANEKAIVVDNHGKDIFKLGSGSGLVVVTGDIEITGNWTGTIIVGGRAYCTEGTMNSPIKLKIDNNVVNNVAPLYFSWQDGESLRSMSVFNIFVGYENFSVNNATNNEGINADMISNCITFTNWNRY